MLWFCSLGQISYLEISLAGFGRSRPNLPNLASGRALHLVFDKFVNFRQFEDVFITSFRLKVRFVLAEKKTYSASKLTYILLMIGLASDAWSITKFEP